MKQKKWKVEYVKGTRHKMDQLMLRSIHHVTHKKNINRRNFSSTVIDGNKKSGILDTGI